MSNEEKYSYTSMGPKAHIQTVSSLNEMIRSQLHSNPEFRSLWVEGEILNLHNHSSGHIYFSLKDDGSQIRCTFFKMVNLNYQKCNLRNGTKVLVYGNVNVYVRKGEYNFNVQKIMLTGEGELRIKIEELKKRLYQEKLFDKSKKKPFPFLPLTLGIATSPTGAVVKDMLQTAWRRYPNLNITLAPCNVQGEGSPDSIVRSLQILNQPEYKIDLIILGRGGGSFEDLLAFNDEKVVRAVASSRVPILSAVGHEIDHPLTDLVADAYDVTPSAAIEKVIPLTKNWIERIQENSIRHQVALKIKIQEESKRLNQLLLSSIFSEPLLILTNWNQTLDYLEKNLEQLHLSFYQEALRKWERFSNLSALFKDNLSRWSKRFHLSEERLKSLSPLATLKRGYSIVYQKNGKIVRSSEDVSIGANLRVLLGKGNIQIEVKDKE